VLSSSAATGRFASRLSGPWTTSLSLPVAAGGVQTPPFVYRDTAPGTATVTASAAGYAGTTQSETIAAAVCAPPKAHDHGVEVTLGHSRSVTAAALLRGRAAKQLHGQGAKLVVEQDSCTDFELAITGLRNRAAALALMRRLRPAFETALEGH
jgi:hypothetical protein